MSKEIHNPENPQRDQYPTITSIDGANWGRIFGLTTLLALPVIAAMAIPQIREDMRLSRLAQEHLANAPTVTRSTPSDWYMIQDGKSSAYAGEGDHGGYNVSFAQYENQFRSDNPNLRILSGRQNVTLRDTNSDGEVAWERSE